MYCVCSKSFMWASILRSHRDSHRGFPQHVWKNDGMQPTADHEIGSADLLEELLVAKRLYLLHSLRAVPAEALSQAGPQVLHDHTDPRSWSCTAAPDSPAPPIASARARSGP